MAAVLSAWRWALLGAALLAAACASNGASGRAEARGVAAGEMRFDVLTPAPLPEGACGLYLWARSGADPLFMLVAYDNPAEAHVRPNGRDRVLRRTAFAGDAVAGHFEQQTFSDGRLTIEADLTFDETRPLRDGAILERGVLRVRDREGWETILPVGGMVSCGVG